MEHNQTALLSIQSLHIGFDSENGTNEVVHGISYEIHEGEILGVVGESGSGKSVTALSILGLLAQNGHIINGTISFQSSQIQALNQRQLEKIRGKQISYVFQEPMTSLNPVLTIGKQLEEMLLLHESIDANERKERMLHALEEVGLPQGKDLLSQYPHQLSGGMRQRVMIAMAMICKPKLLIADEPTTALDVTVQAKVLRLLKELNQNHGTAILLISHDLSVIKSICDRVVVMKDGSIVEQGTVEEVYKFPKKEYTKQLLQAALHIHSIRKDKKTVETEQRLTEEVLSVEHLFVSYPGTRKSIWSKRVPRTVVKDASLTIRQGEIFGIVGGSGCGKSTLVKAIIGINRMTKGEIVCSDKHPQMVFQDPYSSLNPCKTIGWLLEEPLRLLTKDSQAIRKQKVYDMLIKIGLGVEYENRFPVDLSGGQRQRVAIGMAIITNPQLVVLDEPVSSLDVTIQEQILLLLLELREEYQLSYLFISHDMGVVRKLCDRVAVMHDGEIIEVNDCEEVFAHPMKEYTKQLIRAAKL